MWVDANRDNPMDYERHVLPWRHHVISVMSLLWSSKTLLSSSSYHGHIQATYNSTRILKVPDSSILMFHPQDFISSYSSKIKGFRWLSSTDRHNCDIKHLTDKCGAACDTQNHVICHQFLLLSVLLMEWNMSVPPRPEATYDSQRDFWRMLEVMLIDW